MAINENIVTGRKFRKLVDEANKLWQRISFWTKASDVEFDDGSTAEIKVGAINGVTDSLTSTSSNIAASAAAVKALNDKVTELSSNIIGTLTVRAELELAIAAGNSATPIGYTRIDVSKFKNLRIANMTSSGYSGISYTYTTNLGQSGAVSNNQSFNITNVNTFTLRCSADGSIYGAKAGCDIILSV